MSFADAEYYERLYREEEMRRKLKEAMAKATDVNKQAERCLEVLKSETRNKNLSPECARVIAEHVKSAFAEYKRRIARLELVLEKGDVL